MPLPSMPASSPCLEREISYASTMPFSITIPSRHTVNRVAFGRISAIPASYRQAAVMLSQGTIPVYSKSHRSRTGSSYRPPS